MYHFILAAHNLIRWLVFIAGILATSGALLGWLRKTEWSKRDRMLGVIFTSVIDIQLLLGLWLYFVFSPITTGAFNNFAGAMKVPDQRFFAFEHVFYMVFALIFAHLGSMLPKKVNESQAKFKRAAICFSLAILSILIGIPWWRPLLPSL